MDRTVYQENIQHETASFPLDLFTVDLSHPAYYMAFHCHRDFEIIHVLSGLLQLNLESEHIEMLPGDFALILPETLHGAIPEDCVYELLDFDPCILESGASECSRQISRLTGKYTVLPVVYTEKDEQYRDVLSQMNAVFDTCHRSIKGNELIILGQLLILFSGLRKFYTDSEKKQLERLRDNKTLRPVFDFIAENYQKPLTLKDLAESIDVTPHYLCELFSTIINTSPVDFLNYYRIDRAAEMVLQGLSVAEISDRCGFKDSSYFTKVFKKFKKKTPTEYRISGDY